MSMQDGLTMEEKKQILQIIENHNINLVYEEIEDGETTYNEVSINISNEEGINLYIQVN